MKLLTFYAGENEIRVHNNTWNGREEIYHNDVKVSSKFSFFGKCHKFEVQEDGEWVDYKINLKFGMWGLGFDIIRNGVALMLAY